jgi:hypothetical protein
MLSTTNENESNSSLASGKILNFLNNSLQEDHLLVTAIILMILFWMYIILLSAEFPPKNYTIWHDGVEVSKVN